MKRVAVILSGCGVFDGSEIHEAIMSMLAIDQLGGEYTLFAPNKNQAHVIDHLNGEISKETRNVLVEAARIARGKIQPLENLSANDFDALVIPGGYGVAKNLSDYAFKGENFSVDPVFENIVKAFYKAKKPIAALCIAPVVIAKIIGQDVQVTIGSDQNTAGHINQFGAKHVETNATGVVVDKNHKIVTTPCYMLASRISEIYEGAYKAIKELFELMS
ncbi:MAG: isoprenoid biosynthesis glyoxalase ElbB [Bacteroidales bacterium]|nr:isoprenoid biosynthesis glyoxalase ElbB [Bacteroidales bacterium]